MSAYELMLVRTEHDWDVRLYVNEERRLARAFDISDMSDARRYLEGLKTGLQVAGCDVSVSEGEER